MQQDWNTHGPESFVFYCVCECAADSVLELEAAACAEFGALDKDRGYNTQPILGRRFRGGRPRCRGTIRFSRVVGHEQAKAIAQLLELTDMELVRLELGSSKGWLAMKDGNKRVIGLTEPKPATCAFPDGQKTKGEVDEEADSAANIHERSQPHPLVGRLSESAANSLRKQLWDAQARVRELEAMYASG